MGQYVNQPDFITNDIQTVTPVAVGSLTAADSLNGAVLYIGTSTGSNTDLQVIPTGIMGPSVVTGFASTGQNGSGYANSGTGVGVVNVTGSGSLMTVDFTAVNGAIQTVTVNTGGSGYKQGDLVTINIGGNAVFRVLADPSLPTANEAITFTNVPQGEWFPVVVDYVLSGGTTVSDIIAGK